MYMKTSLGRSEIETNQLELTQIQRRVLILVNGKNDSAALLKMSLCDDISEIVEFLVSKNLIELPGSQQTQSDVTKTQTDVTKTQTDVTKTQTDVTIPEQNPTLSSESELGIKEFLCNTLLTYGNRVRTAGLIEEINKALDMQSLKDLISPWYREIADSPSGMYDADNLKKRVMEMLAQAEPT